MARHPDNVKKWPIIILQPIIENTLIYAIKGIRIPNLRTYT